MKLGEFLEMDKRRILIIEQEPDVTRRQRLAIVAEFPYTKNSEIQFSRYSPGEGWAKEPQGYVMFGSVEDIEEWEESFNDRDDPTQELIDYINSLNAETK